MKLISLWMTLVLMGLALGARAGVEPSPFKASINKLDAVSNLLATTEKQLVATLDEHPPDPCVPTDPDVPPAPCMIEKLEAVAQNMAVADKLVAAVIETLPAEPPSDEDLVAAFFSVRDGAEVIADAVFDVLHPPDPCTPSPDDPIVQALDTVLATADALVDRIEIYLDVSAPCDESCDAALDECLASGGSREICGADWTACTEACD